MSWRPENWDTIYRTELENKLEPMLDVDYCDGYWDGVEDGVDTILTALKERGIFILGAQAGADESMLKTTVPNERGWLVFIPEKEAK